jgi:hypothetical protein
LLAECSNRELHGLQLNSRHRSEKCAVGAQTSIPGNYWFLRIRFEPGLQVRGPSTI